MQQVKVRGFVLLSVLIISGVLAWLVLEEAHEVMLAKKLEAQKRPVMFRGLE